jgi:hypothetical protein
VSWRLLAAATVLSGGCGLVLDLTPPARDAGIDAPIDAAVARPDVWVEPGVDAALDALVLEDDAYEEPTDAGIPPCEGRPDGHPCDDEPRRICVREVCSVAECGDGYVDASGGEACEPSLDGRGCNPFTCQWQCLDDFGCPSTACLIGRCASDRACDYELRSGSCALGAMDGTCVDGRCAPSSCGDGVVGPGEQCDAESPGCTACRFDCLTNTDCQDGDPCDGSESCVSVFDTDGNELGRQCRESIDPVCLPEPCYASRCVVTA